MPESHVAIPIDLPLTSLAEGTEAEWRYVISQAAWRTLTEVFGDVNPVHVDQGLAVASGFEGCVMHGAILNGFASHFIGMILPGKRSLLLSMDLRYLAPSYLADEIVIHGQIVQRVESQAVVVLVLTFRNLTRGSIVARGKAQVRVGNGV